MLKVGDQVFVRDAWIKENWMVPKATIIDIKKDKQGIKEYLLKFENEITDWFPAMALKTE